MNDCDLCPPRAKTTANKHDDLALCQVHWNRWIARYLGSDDQPCAAHLIGGQP